MEIIAHLLEKAASGVGPLIVLLGLLIFVHELGHFLVAKYFKVRVETFSLGFGPKLFKFKRGDTTYALSAIPLGGYVKMYGDDPSLEVPENERKSSFLHKPVGQRIAIVLAGSIMNLLFAALLFTVIALVGDKALAPKVGDITVQSKAFLAGFRSGDQILSVNGKEVDRWDRFKEVLEASALQPVEVKLKRESSNEDVIINFTPQEVNNANVLSMKKIVGGVEGLDPASERALVGVPTPDSIAGKAGLKTGDLIQSLNGKPIETWREFSRQLLNLPKGQLAELTVSRSEDWQNEKAKEQTIQVKFEVPGFNLADSKEVISGDLGREDEIKSTGTPSYKLLETLGIYRSDTFVLSVSPDSPAAKAGLKPADNILSISGQPVLDFNDIIKNVSHYKQGDAPLEVRYERQGQAQTVSLTPVSDTPDKHSGNYEPRFIIGVRPLKYAPHVSTIIWKEKNPAKAAVTGVEQSYLWSKYTLVSFIKLIKAEVSPKNIGSFLSIGQMASQSWEVGLASFLRVMAIISINLFIFNLLPVPVLDGGHLVFFVIEAIRGAPVSLRKLEIAQQVGLFVLLSLMVFALFNDFSRFFGS